MWPTAFTSLLELANSSEEFIPVIVQTLEYFNDDIVDESKRSEADPHFKAVATNVKDTMKETDVPAIINFCKIILENPSNFCLSSITGAIDVIADFIDWNAQALFAEVMPILGNFMQKEETKLNTLFCYFSYIDKKMDDADRLNAIKQVDFISQLTSLDYDDMEVVVAASQIIRKLGLSFLESLMTSGIEEYTPLFFKIVEISLKLFTQDDMSTKRNIVDFLNEFTIQMRRF